MSPAKPSPRPSPGGRGGKEPALTRRGDDLTGKLRKQATEVERKVWQCLRDRQVGGAKFRRQAPIGPYIVDFLCLEARLIVEADGGQHAEEDVGRQQWLEAQGYRVLRFWNNEIVGNLEGVLVTIAKAVLMPSPSGRGLGEGGPAGTSLTPALSRREREK